MRKLVVSVPVEQASLLTFDEARGVGRWGKDTLRNLIDSGEITVIRYGRSIRIPRQSIEAYIQRQIAQQKAG